MSHQDAPRVTITGLVLRTTASRRRYGGPRQMTVRTDTGAEINGTIPISLRATCTTLAGRYVQFTAALDEGSGHFTYPEDGTVLAPARMQ